MGAAKGMLIIIELDCIRALDQGPGSQNRSHFKDVYTHTHTHSEKRKHSASEQAS